MQSTWLNRPWHLRILALVLAAALVWLLGFLAPGAAPLVEEGVGDLAWRLSANGQPERRVVVVDIDERSVRQEGSWPWPRETMARLVSKLNDAGVAVQALDIAFPESKAGDAELAAALQKSRVVMGQIFSLDPLAAPDVGLPTGAVAQDCAPGMPVSNGLVGNAASLLGLPLAGGHHTPRVEQDGVLRKIPALICHQGKAYASLALAALSRAALGDLPLAPPTATGAVRGAAPAEALAVSPASGPGMQPAWYLQSPTSAGQRFASWLAPDQWLTSPNLPGMVVPLDAQGDLRVPYARKREALTSVSAADVLAGRVDAHVLNGVVALIGATAFGIGDTVSTPLSAVAAGVEVHAQLAAGLLDNRIVYSPVAAPALQIMAGLLCALLLLASTARRRGVPVKILPVVGVSLALLCAALGALAPIQWALWLPWAGAALFALLGSAALTVTEHAVTRAQRERLSAHLGAYLPAPMAARLAAIDPTGHLQADRRQVTILVADIRNFSAYAANRPAEQTAAVLHAFSCLAVDVVERHGGVIENIVGDSVLAMWNAYRDPQGKDLGAAAQATQALAAARELLTASQELLASAPVDGVENSVVQPLALGIGLEAGDAIVGSFGPARRRTHAALGEPVTVAVRLQAMTQDLSLPILIGPRMAAVLPAAGTSSQGEYLLQGLSRHCELFAPAAWAEWAAPESVFPQGIPAADRGDDFGPASIPSSMLGTPQPQLSSARAFGER